MASTMITAETICLLDVMYKTKETVLRLYVVLALYAVSGVNYIDEGRD